LARWSDPTAWINGKVPTSSNGLHVQLDVGGSLEDLGTQTAPFVTNDVIGAGVGLGSPDLFVDGFLQAQDVRNLILVQVDGFQEGAAGLDVRHDLTNVKALDVQSNSKVEIGHNFGSTSFSLEGGTNTLILDQTPKGSLDNSIIVLGTAIIELGHVKFDHADFIPPLPGSADGHIQLTNHGVPVYELDNVLGGALTASFGGIDKVTHNDILLIKSS
jgi:hypothetical protein